MVISSPHQSLLLMERVPSNAEGHRLSCSNGLDNVLLDVLTKAIDYTGYSPAVLSRVWDKAHEHPAMRSPLKASEWEV